MCQQGSLNADRSGAGIDRYGSVFGSVEEERPMTARRRTRITGAASTLVVLLASGTTSGQTASSTAGAGVGLFRVVNLGTFDQGMLIRTVNNAGEVVGGAQVSPSGDRAFVVTRSRLDAIHGLPD
jgi:hypothetical protein